MLIRFAHLGVVREPLVRDDDAVELAIAADHFLIDSMKDVCISAVRSMVTEGNIWSFLERLSDVKLFDVAAACYLVVTNSSGLKSLLNKKHILNCKKHFLRHP